MEQRNSKNTGIWEETAILTSQTTTSGRPRIVANVSHCVPMTYHTYVFSPISATLAQLVRGNLVTLRTQPDYGEQAVCTLGASKTAGLTHTPVPRTTYVPICDDSGDPMITGGAQC